MTLREQKKAETRATILRVAHQLFHAKGFDQTTLEEICSGAKISKRTLLRYFPDKEALVFPNRDDRLHGFVAFLDSGPDDENPFETLRRATRLFGAQYGEHQEAILTQQRLVTSSPALRARETEIDRDWEAAIAVVFASRLGPGPEAALWSRVLAGAIMGVVRATMSYWFEGECTDDLTQLGLDAIECLERGFPTVLAN